MSTPMQRYEQYVSDILAMPTSPQMIIVNSGNVIHFSRGNAWVIGRRSSKYPDIDIDLSAYHAREFGVSHRHARIIHTIEGFAIEDLSSKNETNLNNYRLLAGQMYQLANGDTVHLGNLKCIFIVQP